MMAVMVIERTYEVTRQPGQWLIWLALALALGALGAQIGMVLSPIIGMCFVSAGIGIELSVLRQEMERWNESPYQYSV